MGRGAASEDEVKRIKALLLTRKYTAQEIAAEIGRSKGSVCGLVWRIPELRAIGLMKPAARKPRPRTEEEEALERLLEAQGVDDAHDLAYGAGLLKGPQPLTRLASHHCRFPMWPHAAAASADSLFCAEARVGESSYCEHHRKVCVAPLKGRPWR